MNPISLTPPAPRRRGLPAAVGIALAFFAAVAPTLHFDQLHDSIENLTVATALEMRRGGPWLVPDLQGVPRLAKPPLTAWLTAASIRPATVAALNTPDPTARAAAYDRLARQARLPALVAACVLLLFAYGLGWAVAGPGDGVATGLIVECVCGTTLLLLRHARIATPDIQLALWVTAANFFLALAWCRGRRWAGCCGAGAALGLAFMCKGPVAFVQTLLPFGAYAVVDRIAFRPRRDRGRPAGWVGPAVVGLVLTAVVGGWWYAYVASRFPDLRSYWFGEATGLTTTNVPPGKWYKYAASAHLFLPWLVWLACGAWMALVPALPRRFRSRRSPAGFDVILRSSAGSGVFLAGDERPFGAPRVGVDDRVGADGNACRRRTAVLGLLLLAVPLAAMSFSRSRFQRYMVPMAAGGALLAAGPLVEFLRTGGSGSRGRRTAEWVAVAVHWLVFVGVCASVAFAGMDDDRPGEAAGRVRWLAFAGAGGLGLAATAAGLLWQRRWRGAVVAVVAVGMAAFQFAYYRADARGGASRSTLRPVADAVWRRYPDAEIYAYRPPGDYIISAAGNDLSIHLNRPLRWAADPSQVPPSDRPQVFVIYRPHQQGRPPLRPAGWELLDSPRGTNEERYVFVRLAGAASREEGSVRDETRATDNR